MNQPFSLILCYSIKILKPTSVSLKMARNPMKRDQPQTQKLAYSRATTERREVEHPMSSGDTVAIDFDVSAEDGPLDEGYHTNHDNKKTGKS